MKTLVLAAVWMMTSGVWAATPPSPLQNQVQPMHQLPRFVQMSRTLDALDLPTSNALKALSAQGPGGYKNLIELAFAESQPINVQWKSLMMLSLLGGEFSLPQLERAATSEKWYHRNGSLMALPQVSRDKALKWARHMLHDPSLIVRSSAVQTLRRLHDTQSTVVLWQQLYDDHNFMGGQSLWVRRHIVEALAELAVKGDEGKLIGVLSDKDASLAKPAIAGLERLTQQQMGQPQEPVAYKKVYWQKWWAARHSDETVKTTSF